VVASDEIEGKQSGRCVAADCRFFLMATRDIEKKADEEQIHFQNVITAFQRYAPYTVSALVRAHVQHSPLTQHRQLAGNNRRRKDVFTLPREDQALLEQLGYKRKLAAVDDAILTNSAFLNQIVANPAIFENGTPGDEEDNQEALDGSHDEGPFGKLVAISNYEQSWQIREMVVASR
jgi:hypothetical protein